MIDNTNKYLENNYEDIDKVPQPSDNPKEQQKLLDDINFNKEKKDKYFYQPTKQMEVFNDKDINKYEKYFDKDYLPIQLGKNEMDMTVGDYQSNIEKVAKGTANFLPLVGLKTIENVGLVLGTLGYAANGFDDVDNIFHNVIVDTMEDAQKYITEDYMPVYKSHRYNGSLGEKMTSLSYWMSDGVDMGAFIGSAIIPGTLLGKGVKVGKLGVKGLNLAEKLQSGINKLAESETLTSKALRSANILAKAEDVGEAGAKIGNFAKTAERSVVSTYNATAESLLEARGVRDKIYDDLISATGKEEYELDDITREDFKKHSAEGAMNTFYANMPLLLFREWTFNKLFDKFTPKTSIVDKLSDIKPITTKDYAKTLGTRLFNPGEAFEESYQLAASDYFTEKALGKRNDNFVTGMISNLARNFTTDEGLESIIAGGIIGAPQSMVMGVKQLKSDKKLAEFMQNNISRTDTTLRDIYETDENGNFIRAEKDDLVHVGGYKVDKSKLNAYLSQANDILANMAAMNELKAKGLSTHWDTDAKMMDSKLMYDFLSQPEGDKVYEAKIKNDKNDNIKERIKNEGVENESKIRQEEEELYNERLKQVKVNQNILEYIDNNHIENYSEPKGKEGREYKEVLRASMYNIMSTLNHLKSLAGSQTKTSNKKGKLIDILDEVNEAVNYINKEDTTIDDIPDNITKRFNINKEVLNSLSEEERIKTFESVKKSLKDYQLNLQDTVNDRQKQISVLEDYLNRLSTKEGKDNMFKQYITNVEEVKKKYENIEKKYKEYKKNLKTNTRFDKVIDKIYNGENSKLDTVFNRYIDKQEIDETKKDEEKLSVKKFQEFSNKLQDVENELNKNYEGFYIDDKLNEDKINEYVSNNEILQLFDPADSTNIVKDILLSDDKSDEDVKRLNTEAEQLTSNLKVVKNDIKEELIYDKNSEDVDKIETVKTINSNIKEMRNNPNIRLKIIDKNNNEFISTNYEVKNENNDIILLFKNDKGEVFNNGIKLTDILENSFIKLTGQESVEELINSQDELLNQLLPEGKEKVLSHIKLLNKQKTELKRLLDEKVSSQRLKNKAISTQIENIKQSIEFINKLIDENNININNDESNEIKTVRYIHSVGSNTSWKASYVVLDRGQFKDKIDGHNYTGEELNNYIQTIQRNKTEFFVSIDTKTSEYTNDMFATEFNKLVAKKIDDNKTSENPVSSFSILISSYKETKNDYPEIDTMICKLNSVDNIDELSKDIIYETLYDLIDLSIKNPDKVKNSKGFELWLHKPQRLLNDGLNLIQLGSITKDNLSDELYNLRNYRKEIINALVDGTPIIKVAGITSSNQSLITDNRETVKENLDRTGNIDYNIQIITTDEEINKQGSLSKYIIKGNTVVSVKGDNGKFVKYIAKVNNISDEHADIVIKMLQDFRAKSADLKSEDQYSIKVPYENSYITITGTFEDVFNNFIKWNKSKRLDKETGEVITVENKNRFEFGKNKDSYGLFYGNNFIKLEDLQNNVAEEIGKLKEYLTTQVYYNIDNKSINNKTSVNILDSKGNKVLYKTFIQNFLSIPVKITKTDSTIYPVLTLSKDITFPVSKVKSYKDTIPVTIDKKNLSKIVSAKITKLLNFILKDLETVKQLNYKVVDYLEDGNNGMYDEKTNTITLSKQNVNTKEQFEVLLTHETLHPFIIKHINEEQRKKVEKLITAIIDNESKGDKYIQEYINKILKARLKNGIYDKTAVDEFIAYGLSDKSIAEFYNNTTFKNEDGNIIKSIWDELMDIIKDVLGLKIKDGSVLKELMNILNTPINNTQIINPSQNVNESVIDEKEDEIDDYDRLNQLLPNQDIEYNKITELSKTDYISAANSLLLAYVNDDNLVDSDYEFNVPLKLSDEVLKNNKPIVPSIQRLIEAAINRHKKLVEKATSDNNIKETIKEDNLVNNLTLLVQNLDKLEETIFEMLEDKKISVGNEQIIKDEIDENETESTFITDDTKESSKIQEHIVKPMQLNYRETANGSIKAIVNNMYDIIGTKENGEYIYKTDNVFGFKQPANPSLIWSILINNLHNSKDITDIFGKNENGIMTEGKLAKIARRFPIIKQLLDKFVIEIKDNKYIPKVPLTKFIQFAETFKKHKSDFIKTQLESKDGKITIRKINQTKSETTRSIIESWNNIFMKSSLYDIQNDKYREVGLTRLWINNKQFIADMVSNNTLSNFNKFLPKSLKTHTAVKSLEANNYYSNDTQFKQGKENIIKLYNELGIDIDINTIDEIINEGENINLKQGYRMSNYEKLQYAVGAIKFEFIFNRLLYNFNKDKISKNNHILSSVSDLSNIVDYYVKSKPRSIETQVSSLDSANYNIYTIPHFIDKIVDAIKVNDFKYIKEFINLPQNRNSLWLQYINKQIKDLEFNPDNEEAKKNLENINTITWNFMEQKGKNGKSKDYQEMNKCEQYIDMINSLFSYDKDGKEIGKPLFSPMTMSSRSTWYKITGFERISGAKLVNGNVEFTDDNINVFFGYLTDELQRIEEVKKQLYIGDSENINDSNWIENLHYYEDASVAIKRWNSLGLKLKEDNLLSYNGKYYAYKIGNEVYPLGRYGEFSIFTHLSKDIHRIKTMENSIQYLSNEIKKTLTERYIEDLIFTKNNGIIYKIDNKTIGSKVFDSNIFKRYNESNDLTDKQKSDYLKLLIADNMLNQMHSIIEFEKLMGIEPLTWKSRSDMTKRMSLYTSTTIALDFSEATMQMLNNETIFEKNENDDYVYNTVVLKDIYLPSENLKDIIEVYKNIYMKEDKTLDEETATVLAYKAASAFESNNVADGQSIISPEMTKYTMKHSGKWIDGKHDIVYDYLQMEGKFKDYNPTTTELENIVQLNEELEKAHVGFNSFKMLHIGTKFVDVNNGKSITNVIQKDSEYHLWKRFAMLNTGLKDLYDRMNLEGKYSNSNLKKIQKVSFDSVYKGYLPSKDKFYNNDTTVEHETFELINDNGIEKLKIKKVHIPIGQTDLKNLKVNQELAKDRAFVLDVPLHQSDEMSLGTQMKKVTMTNINPLALFKVFDSDKKLSGKEMFNELNSVMSQLSNIGRKKIEKELGYDKKTNRFDDKKVNDFIISALKKNKVSEHILDTIKQGLPYDMVGAIREKVYQILNKYIKNNVVDLNLPGSTMVQVSNFGVYKSINDFANKSDIKTLKEFVKEANKLKMNVGKDGLEYWDAIIPISFYKNIIPNYKNNTFEQNRKYLLDNSEILDIIAHRIPTQATSSIIYIKPVNFLPEGTGDSIILPDTLTTSTGSDFDIDKLFVFRYNYKTDRKGNLNKIKYNESNSEEDILNRYENYITSIDKTSKIKSDKAYYEEVKQDYESLTNKKDEVSNVLRELLDSIINNNDIVKNQWTKYSRLKGYKNLSAKEKVILINDFIKETNENIVNIVLNDSSIKKKKTAIQNIQENLKQVSQILNDNQELFNVLLDEYTEIYEKVNKKDKLKDKKDRLINLAKDIDAMSFDEFSKLPILQQNDKKAVQNRLLDLFISILKSNHKATETLAPLDADEMKRNCNICGILSGDIRNLKSLEYYSPQFTIEQKYIMAQSKPNLGPVALVITDIPFAQQLDYKVKGINNIDGLGYIYDEENNTNEPLGNIVDEGNVNMVDLSLKDKNFKNRNGKYTTDDFNYLLTGIVDLEKNEYVIYANINKYTIPVATLLYRNGLSRYTESYIAQPIIKRLVHNNNTYNSILVNKFKVKLKIPNKKNDNFSGYKEPFKWTEPLDSTYYDETEKYYRDLLACENLEDVIRNNKVNSGMKDGYYHPSNYKEPLVSTYVPSTLITYKEDKMYEFMRIQRWINNGKLDEEIESEKAEGQEFKNVKIDIEKIHKFAMAQLNILEHYKELEKISKVVTNSVLAGRSDTNSIFNTKYSSEVNVNKINSLIGLENKKVFIGFKNKMKSYNDFTHQEDDKPDNFSFIGTIYQNHKDLLYSISNQKYIYDTPTFTDYKNVLQDLTKSSSNEKTIKLIANNMYGMIFNDFVKDTYIDSEDKTKFIENLFYGNNNIATQLIDIKNYLVSSNKLNSVMQAFLYQHIIPVIGQHNNPSFVKAKPASSLDEDEVLAYQKLWSEMLDSKDEKIKEFAKNLFIYTIISTGGNYTAFGLGKLIPFDYMVNNGFLKYASDRLNHDELLFNLFNDNLADILLNNSNNNDIIPEIDFNILGAKTVKDNVGNEYKTLPTDENKNKLIIFEKWNKDSKKYLPRTADEVDEFIRYKKLKRNNGETSFFLQKNDNKTIFYPFIATNVPIIKFDNKTGETNIEYERKIFAIKQYQSNGLPIYIEIDSRGYNNKGLTINELGIRVKEKKNNDFDNMILAKKLFRLTVKNLLDNRNIIEEDETENKVIDNIVEEESIEQEVKQPQVEQQSTGSIAEQQSKSAKGFQGYKGGFKSAGKGTPEGDGKDKAMRKVADGFIGEVKSSPYIKQGEKFLINPKHSSTVTSANEINKKSKNNIGYSSGEPFLISITNREKFDENIYPKVIMLARNGELNGKLLHYQTRDLIKEMHSKGVEFVVGDMPNVDSQFIDYLQEIGAKFTIYHTGNESRIKVKEQQSTQQEGNKELLSELLPEETKLTNIGKVLDFMKGLTVEERKAFRKLREEGKFDIDCK